MKVPAAACRQSLFRSSPWRWEYGTSPVHAHQGNHGYFPFALQMAFKLLGIKVLLQALPGLTWLPSVPDLAQLCLRLCGRDGDPCLSRTAVVRKQKHCHWGAGDTTGLFSLGFLPLVDMQNVSFWFGYLPNYMVLLWFYKLQSSHLTHWYSE